MVGSKEVPIHRVAELVGGGTPPRSRSAFFGGPIPWVTPSDLPPIGCVVELGEVRESLTEAGLNASSAKLLRPPAVLFSSRASIGKIAVAMRACATNQGFINFIPDLSHLDPWFLAYYLRFRTPDIIQLAGETTYKEISRGRMREFPILLPPLTEQRRIIARIQECLSRVDEIRQIQPEFANEAHAVLSSVIDEFVMSSWRTVRIGDVCAQIRNGWSGRRDANGVTVQMLRLSCVHQLEVDVRESKPVTVSNDAAKEFAITNYDVLVVRGNGSRHLVGRSAIVKGNHKNVIFNDLLIRLKVRSGFLPEFVNFVCHSARVRRQIESLAKTAAGIWKINQTNLERIEIPCPEIEQQREFVKRVTQARAIAQQLAEAADVDTEDVVKSVLHHAFAGEL